MAPVLPVNLSGEGRLYPWADTRYEDHAEAEGQERQVGELSIPLSRSEREFRVQARQGGLRPVHVAVGVRRQARQAHLPGGQGRDGNLDASPAKDSWTAAKKKRGRGAKARGPLGCTLCPVPTHRLSCGATRRWILSAAALGLIAILAVSSFAAAKVKTFSSGPVGMPIPDAVGQTPSRLRAEQLQGAKTRGTIKDVDVAVRITHPDSTDLTLGLYHRFGVFYPVQAAEGRHRAEPRPRGRIGVRGGGLHETFDDEAPLTLDATSPFAGRCRLESRRSGSWMGAVCRAGGSSGRRRLHHGSRHPRLLADYRALQAV